MEKMYLVCQNDTPLFAISTNEKGKVSDALIDYFDGDYYMTIYRIVDDGEFLFYEYMDCEFSIKEIKRY